MANTRATLGDQATLDGIVNGTLTSLEEDGIVSLPADCLRYNKGLKTVIFPNVTSFGSSCFADSNIETVDLSAAATIGSSAFSGASKLKHLILRNNSMRTLSNVNALNGTMIARGMGAVYVPATLLDTYKGNTNWKNYTILSIEDYPATEFGTIKDSWSEILTAESNGTYKTKYSVGDTKSISINGVDELMEIIAFDADDLADGSGKAKITWLSKGLFASHNMNASRTNTNGWTATAMRSWLRDDIFPTLDSTLRSGGIKEVTKTYYDYTTSTTKSTSDTVWIPSAREMFGGDSYESSGCDYTEYFDSSAKRIKYNTSGSASLWWLRSAYSYYSSGFRIVNSDGSVGTTDAYDSIGVALGFST